MRRALCLVAGLAAVLGLTARAAPFKPSVVPASALWIGHVDADGLKTSETGRLLLSRPEWKESPAVAGFASRFGLDPATEMRGLTLYTVGTGRLDAVAVIDPDPAAFRRLKGWRGLKGWSSKAYDGHAVYSRATGTDTLYQAVAADGRIVAGLTLANVRQGMAVMDGKSPALAGASMPALGDRREGAGDLVLVAARSPGADMTRMIPQLSLLKNADSLYAGFFEKDGVITGGLTVSAPTEAEAERVEKALAAMVELVKSMYGGAVSPLRTVAVTREGGRVRADGRWKQAELLSLLGMGDAASAGK